MTCVEATTKTEARLGIQNLAWPEVGTRVLLLASTAFTLGLAAGLITTDTFLVVPEATAGSWSVVGEILRANLTLWFALLACAGLQPLARSEIANGSRPWIRWITTLVVVCFVGLNCAIAGVVIGHLGSDAALRILPHAPFELLGFGFGIYAFLLAREGGTSVRRAAILFAISLGLLTAGAIVESFISGGVS